MFGVQFEVHFVFFHSLWAPAHCGVCELGSYATGFKVQLQIDPNLFVNIITSDKHYYS